MPAPPTQQPPHIRRGMTLIEIVLVAIVVAFLATLTVPKISARAYRADAEARHTQAVLQLAQRLAVTTQHNVIVSFDSSHHRIRVLEDANGDRLADSHERLTWHALEYGLRFAVPVREGATPTGIEGRAIRGRNLQTVDGMPSLIFKPNGSTTSDVEIYLGTARSVPQDFRIVSVAQATGEAMYDHVPLPLPLPTPAVTN